MRKETVKVRHVTLYNKLPSGVRRQIESEIRCSRKIEGIEWSSVAVHSGPIELDFEVGVPLAFKYLGLRKLYLWIYLIRIQRKFDLLLVRHVPFDLWSVVFSWIVKNRVSIHHSKEVEELRQIRGDWRGRLASRVENITGRLSVRRARAVLAVTRELGQFQVASRAPDKQWGFYPNGIDLDLVQLVSDRRSRDSLCFVFLSHTFSPWHGLDRVLSWTVQDMDVSVMVLHLVGNLGAKDLELVRIAQSRGLNIVCHGHLDRSSYLDLLSASDVGFASFAMDRNSMIEGTTLKVRELLAMGIAVYSGHLDSACPPDFPYFCMDSDPGWRGAEKFARKMKQVPRAKVRAEASPWIDKSNSMRIAAEFLKSL
jgi:hypothetical protein